MYEKWREMQRQVMSIRSTYQADIDSKVVQLVSHNGELYCLCDNGRLFVWDGEDPGKDAGDVEGWRWLDSPADQARVECNLVLKQLAKEEAEDES